MKNMLSRPARAALPLLLAACTFMRGGSSAIDVAAAILLARLSSLCAGGALRAAAASVVNASRLRGNLMTAAIMAVIGCAVVAVMRFIEVPYICGIPYFTILAGGLINLAQVLSDRMYASADAFSPLMYDMITAVFCVFALIVSDSWLMPVLCAVPALAGCMLLFGLRQGVAVKPGFKVLTHAPGAILKGGLFPGLLAGGALYVGDTVIACAALAGWAVLDMAEPIFRRTGDERAACGIILTIGAAGCAVCAAFIPDIRAAALIATAFAFICAQVTGMRPDIRRTGIWILLIIAAALALEVRAGIALAPMTAAVGAAAASAVALGLCVPDIRDLKRIMHARSLQKRRARRV